MKTEFLDAQSLRQSVERLQSISRLIVLRDTPVVAAVQGWAVGGGLSWALNCDVVLFGESAKAFFPEVTLGLGVTGGVTSLLPALVGPNRARELLYFGAKLGVREANAWGMISASVRDEALDASARARAEAFRDLPHSATRKVKRLFSDLQRDDFERALANECEALIELVSEMIAAQSWPE
jgi:enoyl-CoA hydratase/carnithine racemase